ncbi:hypothetical protein DRQ25_13720 [Candidatus Fermentibacteria bacterium]|nr:MAG: hypothetical protein DRQ25_13720 [Candidatus Fermentibacteria bacterium]
MRSFLSEEMNLDLGVPGQFPEEFAGQLLGLLRTRTNTASRRSVELKHYNMVLQHVVLKADLLSNQGRIST